MECSRSVARWRLVLRVLICGAVLCPVLVVGRAAHDAEATPSAGCRTMSFGAGHDVGASTDHVLSMTVGDLDNDGDLDIVSGSYSSEDYEVIAWQNDGSPFTDLWPQNDVGARTDHVRTIAVGDLDNDGDLDIVSGSYSGEDYEIIAWENDGSPFTGLWSPTDVGATTDNVISVALGDLDNDGYLDVVSGTDSAEDYEVIAWENDGTPFNGPWTQRDVGTSADAVISVALGDLDDDGDLDIVSGSDSGEDYEVIAWENDGSPFDSLWSKRYVGASNDMVRSVALGDLDNDGDLDIVSASHAAEDYEVIAWENDGSPFDGLWPQHDVGASTASVYWAALGDLDNDGDLDIVTGSGSAEDYEVIAWQNNASPFDGLWSQYDVGASTSSVYSVAPGDLDNDGDLDIASSSGSGEDYELIAWENTLSHRGMGFWQGGADVGATSASLLSVAVGDLDDDGDLDIVSGSWSSANDIIVWQNDSSPFAGVWSGNPVGNPLADVRSVALGDLDSDGDLDIVSVTSSAEDYEVIAWENDGSPFSGSWPQNDVGASDDWVNEVALGDLDNDGDLDIVSGSASGEDYEVIAWENDGSPFTDLWSQNDVGTSSSVYALDLGDLDNDGDLDIVSGSDIAEDYEVIVWQNDGSPFTDLWSQNDVGTSSSVYALDLGDLDNDGDLDIVSGSDIAEDYEVIVWENDGTPFSGLWSQNDAGASADWVYSVALADLDNDGDLDIVSGSGPSEDYEIILWQSDGSPFSGLWSQQDLGATDAVSSVAQGDLDHDGDLDVVSGSYMSADYEVMAWRNRASDCYTFVPLALKNYTP